MMKRNRIYARIAGVALAALAITGCSDTWDDHYGDSQSDAAVGSSLWEMIRDNDQLSNFAQVLKETKYDRALGSSQVFTVFAPTNDAFTAEDAADVIKLYEQEKQKGVKEKDNRAIKEFVQNHIALYNHSVATSGADSLVMMNGKYLVLTPQTLGDSPLLTTNVLTKNGLLFTLGDVADYHGNVFEAVQSDSDLDSIGNFIAAFNEYEFRPSLSVAGGIEDGRTWYLDSVSVLTNDIFYYTDYINSEDSVFWMVAPTNDVWNELVKEYEPYFNYDSNVQKRDSLCWVRPRLAVVTGTVFSQTRNAKRVGDEFVWNTDSAMSVNAADYNMRRYAWGRSDMKYYQYDNPFDEGGAYTGTREIDCSNGKVIVADKWNIDKKETFFLEVLVEGEDRTCFDQVNEVSTQDPVYQSIESWSPFYNKVSNNRFVNIMPKSFNSEARFKLPDLLSNIGYDIYVVFVPLAAVDSMATEFLPCKFQASISYHKENGDESPFYFLPDNRDDLSRTEIHNYETDPNVVDSVLLISDYKFPTCSWGLNESQVFLNLKVDLRSSEQSKYTGYMRIDCIILKPHEETAVEDE